MTAASHAGPGAARGRRRRIGTRHDDDERRRARSRAALDDDELLAAEPEDWELDGRPKRTTDDRRRGAQGRVRVRIVSADWVVPVEGAPDRARRRRDRRRRHDRRRRARLRARTGRASRRMRDPPGLRQRALAPRVRRLRRIRRRAPVRALDRAPRPAQGRARLRRHDLQSRLSAPSRASARASRPRATAASREPPRSLPRRPGCALSSTSRSSVAMVRRSTGSTSHAARIEHVLSERIRLGVSPHAPYTCTLDDYRACAALGLPQATHFAESAAEREWLVDGAGDWSPLARFLVRADGRDRHPAPGRGGPPRAWAHGGTLRPRRRRRDRASRTCRGRRGALSALERLSRLRRRPAGRAEGCRCPGVDCDRQPRLGAVVRHVRGDSHRDRLRAGACGAARRALRRRQLWSSQPWAVRAFSGWQTRSDRSFPASRPT